MNPPDIIAAGAPTDIKLCADCIDAYRNGIEPGESACEARFALLSAQGTACAETALDGHDYLDPAKRAAVERAITGPDAPIAGTWTDCTGNDALR